LGRLPGKVSNYTLVAANIDLRGAIYNHFDGAFATIPITSVHEGSAPLVLLSTCRRRQRRKCSNKYG
jgi:hypothetical protein